MTHPDFRPIGRTTPSASHRPACAVRKGSYRESSRCREPAASARTAASRPGAQHEAETPQQEVAPCYGARHEESNPEPRQLGAVRADHHRGKKHAQPRARPGRADTRLRSMPKQIFHGEEGSSATCHAVASLGGGSLACSPAGPQRNRFLGVHVSILALRCAISAYITVHNACYHLRSAC